LTKEVYTISEIIEFIINIKIKKNIVLAFRGEKEDYKETALVPSLYRNKNFIKNEELIYREMQRFNDNEFIDDRTTFDKLSRIQHYSAPTRLLDISEDIMSAIYFAISDKQSNSDAILYIFEIDEKKIKYYDSDAVSVVSNIVKLPLNNKCQKSKKALLQTINKYQNSKKEFNQKSSIKFLMHEIREEKSQFKPIIKARDLTSVLCVRPKLTNNRLKLQKGFFLLFGFNPNGVNKPIQLFKNKKVLKNCNVKHPIKEIHELRIKSCKIEKMKMDLKKLGITQPFVYPEIDQVANYLKAKYS
jgi:hypothetical protein